MNRRENLADAKLLVDARISFAIHLFVFVLVMTLLLVINLATSPWYWWFLWPLVGWGIGVACHGAVILWWSQGQSLRRRLIVQELQRRRRTS